MSTADQMNLISDALTALLNETLKEFVDHDGSDEEITAKVRLALDAKGYIIQDITIQREYEGMIDVTTVARTQDVLIYVAVVSTITRFLSEA